MSDGSVGCEGLIAMDLTEVLILCFMTDERVLMYWSMSSVVEL